MTTDQITHAGDANDAPVRRRAYHPGLHKPDSVAITEDVHVATGQSVTLSLPPGGAIYLNEGAEQS